MGERYNSFLNAFDGAALDWNAVLGAGFDASPKGWVSVFRECSMDELMRIVKQGMTPTPPEIRHPDIRREMELLDRFRPARIARLGISRLRAIYAVPTRETPRFPFRRERVILEMKVDPAESFVGDMDFITALIPFIEAHRGRGLDRYQGAFRKYWDSIIPLEEFFGHYDETRTDSGGHWSARSGAPDHLPRTYFMPEVLVMTPMVSPQFVRVVGRESTDGDCEDCGHGEHPPEFWEEAV